MEGTPAQPAGKLITRRHKTTDPSPEPAPPPPEAAPDDGYDAGPAERALVLLPGAEPTDAQCDAVAAALGLTKYEARLRLREPLPRVTHIGPAAEVQATADGLAAAGVRVEALSAAPLTSPPRPFVVDLLKIEGDSMRLTGARGELLVDLRQPALLVGGRYDFKVTADVGNRRAEAVDMVMFGHLYAGGFDEPIELVESNIADWEFLGGAKTPIRRANFQATLELLRRFPSVTWNDSLLQSPGRIKECLHGLAARSHFIVGGDATNATERSNVGGADLLSRVIYQLWRARLGDRVAAHDAGLTVVSTVDPEAKVVEAFGGGPRAIDLAHPKVREGHPSGRASRAAGLIPPPDLVPEPPPARDSARLRRPDASAHLSGDPTRPLRPNPPGAPPLTLVLRGLSLSVPHGCVCCLRPPGRRAIEATASSTDVGAMASTTIGLLTFLTTGFGWFRTKHGEEVVLKVPACETCRKHETADELAWVIAVPIVAVGVGVTLSRTGLPGSAGLIAAIVVGWGLALIVLGLALSVALSQHGPGCAGHRPLRVSFKGGDFKVVFGNRSYGERVAELNAPLVVDQR